MYGHNPLLFNFKIYLIKINKIQKNSWQNYKTSFNSKNYNNCKTNPLNQILNKWKLIKEWVWATFKDIVEITRF